MQETTPNCEGNKEKKTSQVLVGNKCALGLPAKAYMGNKTKGILEREKRQSWNGESILLFSSPLIVGVEQCNIHVWNASQVFCWWNGMGMCQEQSPLPVYALTAVCFKGFLWALRQQQDSTPSWVLFKMSVSAQWCLIGNGSALNLLVSL